MAGEDSPAALLRLGRVRADDDQHGIRAIDSLARESNVGQEKVLSLSLRPCGSMRMTRTGSRVTGSETTTTASTRKSIGRKSLRFTLRLDLHPGVIGIIRV